MSYRGKIPYTYDRNSAVWRKGAFANQIGPRATQADAEFLARRQTKYHRFVERKNGIAVGGEMEIVYK